MPDLTFAIVDVEIASFAAIPTLVFKLNITNSDEQEYIQTIALRSQLQIAATRRRYSAQAQAQLVEVFGEPHRWGETLRNLLWQNLSTIVPSFSGSTVVDVPVPCSYDFELVSTKYFNAVQDGSIPLLFLFSGTIFYTGKEHSLQVAQISWSKETTSALPAELWQTMMTRYYPQRAWLHLHKDVFDQLYQYKATHGFPTWEETFVRLLQLNGEEAHI